MLRFACALLLFVIACSLAGVYGAVHNQISYTVSPEYFTAFKFHQFGVEPSYGHRLGAAVVGWQASWWMGLIIGGFLIPFGMLIRDTSTYFFWMLRVFGLVMLTTLMFGLVALTFSYLTMSPATADALIYYGNQITDPTAFLRAGAMHNASYLGGLVGIIVGMVSLLRRFLLAETGSSKITR